MRRFLALLTLFPAVSAVAQPTPYGPWPRLGIPDPPAPRGAAAHRVAQADNGIIVSYLQGGGPGIQLCFLRLTEAGWSDPAVVAQDRAMVANWADVPAVVQGGDGALYAHWLSPFTKTAQTYSIRVLRSADGGKAWTDLGVLNDDDGYDAPHGFVSYAPDPLGVRAYWLDGRETAPDQTGPAKGFMTLRTALIGESVEPSELVDGAVCDCCATAAATTDDGPIVVYRDRTEDEVRDIGIAGGAAGAPRVLHRDGWVIPGCPVNGPAVRAQGNTVAVAWFTAAGAGPRVLAALSTDGGASFHEPILVDEARGQDVPQGRVDLTLDGDSAIVSWLATRDRTGAIMLQRVHAGGKIGRAKYLAPMDTGRFSGFPQMGRVGDRIVMVWRDPDAKALRAAALGVGYIGRD